MVKRPLKDRDRVFPILDRPILAGSEDDDFNIQEQEPYNIQEQEPYFESVDDLPDSPMLRQFIEREAEYLDAPIEEIINSDPVRDYMKKLGVWKIAVEENNGN